MSKKIKKELRMKKSSKLTYDNGTWFAVPLRTRGFAIGMVTRMDGKGIVLGYFFGPRFELLPTIDDTLDLLPNRALLICQFGDLGLLDKGWPILGKSPVWSMQKWPIPVFARFSGIDDDMAWEVTYADDLSLVTEKHISAQIARQMPSNGLFSAGAIEIRLTKFFATYY